jgi:hypothetical protein
VGWAKSWATAGWLWAAVLGCHSPIGKSLSFSYFCFLFSDLNLMFEFKFDFCFVLQVLKYFNIQTI